MARGRPTKALKDLAESTLRHKKRLKDRRDGPLQTPYDPPLSANPPAWLDLAESFCWRKFIEEMPWLTRADSTVVELASKLRARSMTGTLSVSKSRHLASLCAELGGKSLGRDRTRQPPENAKDEPHDNMFDW